MSFWARLSSDTTFICLTTEMERYLILINIPYTSNNTWTLKDVWLESKMLKIACYEYETHKIPNY